MKKYLTVLLFIANFSAVSAMDKGKWTGFISDDKCAKKVYSKDHAECAKSCVKGGAKPVFVVNEKSYTISDPKKVVNFIGNEVTITGEIDKSGVLVIETIEMK